MEAYLNPEQHKFLNQLRPLIDDAHVYWYGNGPFSRKNADGIMTFIVKTRKGSFGIIYNDFKINGGSFGRSPSKRAIAFVKEMKEQGNPIAVMTNSIGVRIMEGRKVFNDAFGLIPALCDFAESNLLLTANMGRSLGIGALIYSLGHYRYSLKSESLLNLTGPEVIKMFFGKGYDYESISSAKKHLKDSALIHEIASDKVDLYNKIRDQLDFVLEDQIFEFKASYNLIKDIYQEGSIDKRVNLIVDNIAEESIELFSQMDETVRVFLIRRNNSLMGILINPPGRTKNIITVKTLEKYQAAYDYFKVLNIPLVSFLDTPGASPLSFIDSKKEVIQMLRDTSAKIIKYPAPKMGFVIGRCFGGASVLGFPKVFGSSFHYVLEGATMGIMHESIIEKLFSQSARLFSQWKETRKTEPEDYSDMIGDGLLDGKIMYEEINLKLDEYQLQINSTKQSASSEQQQKTNIIPFQDSNTDTFVREAL